MKNITTTLVIGFLISLPITASIAIIFEKLKDDLASYSAAIIPLIVVASILLFLCLFSVTILMIDLLKQGCLSWHRDSLGILVQKIIFCTCLLFTVCYTYGLIYFLENGSDDGDEAPTVIGSFIPIIVFSSMALCKLICFKIRNLIYWFSLSVLIILNSILFYVKFDLKKDFSVFIVTIPCVLILLTIMIS